jgi:Zn-dependent protease
MGIERLLLLIPPFIFAITIHEYAHGLVAERLGDPTARFMGRITFNPIAHIDPFGTVLLPLMLILLSIGTRGTPFFFGYAKPVPIDAHNLRNPKRDMIWISLSGPVSNMLGAMAAGILFRLVTAAGGMPGGPLVLVGQMFAYGVYINLLFAGFNLLPVPPLDGFHILCGLLPDHLAQVCIGLERYGFLILIAVLFLGRFLIWGLIGLFIAVFGMLFAGPALGYFV